jgi:PAS domain-containing protein
VSPPSARRLDLPEILGLAVVATTPQGLVTSYNSVAARQIGWTGDSGLGRSLLDHAVEHPDDRPAEPLPEALAAGLAWAGRLTFPHPDAGPDGGTDGASASAVPMRDDDGALTGAFVLSIGAESPLWPLLTGTVDGWLVVHGPGTIGYASRHASLLLGGTAHDIHQLNVVATPGAAAERIGTLLARLAGEGSPPAEFRVPGQDGPDRWVEAAYRGRNDRGPLAGTRWRLRDVTARHRVEESQRARSAELQSALDSRVVIEQAKGFLAGRDGGTPADAFLRLRQYARDHNITLRELSRQVLDGDVTLPLAP